MVHSKARASSKGAEKSKHQRLSSAQRSAYFARREAAKVLRCVIQGDGRRQAVGSVKSLVYDPTIRNKRATLALVCKTLKYLPIIKDVLGSANILNNRWKRQETLIYIICYEILFGQAISSVGDAEKFLMLQKDTLQVALAQLLVRKKVRCIEDLMHLSSATDLIKPRYLRVNTLKMDVDSAILELGKQYKVLKDDMVPDLLMLPPGSDLHSHPLVMNGSVFLQGRASSMVAAVLDPKPGWEVLDACSAPGNKTVHVAALMRGKGKVIACELNGERLKRLKDTIKLSGASNVEVMHGDFLSLNPNDPSFSKVRAIVLDPSCSGSGTAAERLDHLLPSYEAGHSSDGNETRRLNKLATFQKKALTHAFSFPGVERVVYSTCSIHQIENEDVIKSVLPVAESYGFNLGTPFPHWHRRGLPVFEGAQHLLRTDPVEDKEGFFIALFTKHVEEPSKVRLKSGTTITSLKRKRCSVPFLGTNLFKMWLNLN
ncbi:probable 28S rRNA (cytosine-C(5))-methyltransferase [Carica papaya]|uniref:probable 28S rRNA (cytosine-C(5))-methyltransferase n=1 Tax=Carica papaya TaxID=3649 RepID=UPI000B8CEF7B|nr:probable 28S rRNA (cytosine-C(5))-methyltransferase [Carica papaya]